MKRYIALLLITLLTVVLDNVFDLGIKEAIGLVRDPVQKVGMPIRENDFVLMTEGVHCRVLSDTHRHQACTVRWAVQNRSHVARPLEGHFQLLVGDNEYPAIITTGPAFTAPIWPDAQETARTEFEIPLGLVPSRIAVDIDRNGRSVLIDVFPRAGP